MTKTAAATPIEKRPYLVTDIESGDESLVNANSQAQALKHAAMGKFSVKAANTKDVIRLMKGGAQIEEAGA